MKRSIILLSVLLASAMANAQAPETVTLADAQKAYVSGNWKEAAAAYEKVCSSQPKETQVSCNLWGILALSQVGDAKSFKKAGTRLDSLINATNPQQENYADLVMTRAQFMLYLGKYDRAAEELIHAIETSRPNQSLVLQKVCTAVLSRTKSDELSERCEGLKHPDTVATAKPAPQPAQPVAEAPKAAESKPVEAKPAETKPVEQPVAQTQTSAPATPTPAPQAAATTSPTEEYWILQLGAFGVRDNASLLVTNLKKQKISSTIVEMPRGERTLYLVQTGHFSTREEANAYGEKALQPLNVEFQPLLKK